MGKSKFYIGERVKIDIETLSITESYDFVNMIIKFDNENHKIHTITNINTDSTKNKIELDNEYFIFYEDELIKVN